jgi:hypothetical protein
MYDLKDRIQAKKACYLKWSMISTANRKKKLMAKM